MSIQEIEKAVAKLPAEEFDQLMERLEELRQEQWDRQIARDWEAGRFDEAIERAKRDIAAGLGRPL
jgi:predicted transcriptional regulator